MSVKQVGQSDYVSLLQAPAQQAISQDACAQQTEENRQNANITVGWNSPSHQQFASRNTVRAFSEEITLQLFLYEYTRLVIY